MAYPRLAGALVLMALPNIAAAWDFGRRVKGPDYLDTSLYGFGAAAAITFVCVLLTKPRHVALNQMYRTRLSGISRITFRLFQVTGAVFLIILMSGGFLYRYERDFGEILPETSQNKPRIIQLSHGRDSDAG